MPNSHVFTTQVNGKNIGGASIARQRFDPDIVNADASVGEGTVEVQLSGPGGILWPRLFPLAIRNGSCDAIVVQTVGLVYHDDIVKMERLTGGAGIATLFTDCNAADKARVGDANIAGQVMTANPRTNVLRILQAAVGNRAAGASPATSTVIPPGTAS